MSLVLPPFYFAKISDNLAGATPSDTPGTNFTAAANNADGAAVSVLSALGHDCHYLQICAYGILASAVDSTALLDVLIDPAGGTSWSVLIADLAVGCTNISSTAGISAAVNMYHFPLWIPAGASVGVRCRTAHTVDITTGQVMAWANGVPSRPDMWWCGQGVETLGITAASSSSTAITPGNSGSWGSWTSVGSVTSKRFGAIQFGCNGTDANAAAAAYHFQIGSSSVLLPGCPTIHELVRNNETHYRNTNGPIWCDVPVGTQMQVRGTCSTTAENVDVSLYGVY